jgi:hypothetical protein
MTVKPPIKVSLESSGFDHVTEEISDMPQEAVTYKVYGKRDVRRQRKGWNHK